VIFHSHVNVYQRVGEKTPNKKKDMGPPRDSVNSWGSHKWLNELWFMVDITIDNYGEWGL